MHNSQKYKHEEERKWPKNTLCAFYINPKMRQNNTTYLYRWTHIK